MCVLIHISEKVPLGIGPPESGDRGDCEPSDDTWDLPQHLYRRTRKYLTPAIFIAF